MRASDNIFFWGGGEVGWWRSLGWVLRLVEVRVGRGVELAGVRGLGMDLWYGYRGLS